jgi:hypothetical protein
LDKPNTDDDIWATSGSIMDYGDASLDEVEKAEMDRLQEIDLF